MEAAELKFQAQCGQEGLIRNYSFGGCVYLQKVFQEASLPHERLADRIIIDGENGYILKASEYLGTQIPVFSLDGEDFFPPGMEELGRVLTCDAFLELSRLAEVKLAIFQKTEYLSQEQYAAFIEIFSAIESIDGRVVQRHIQLREGHYIIEFDGEERQFVLYKSNVQEEMLEEVCKYGYDSGNSIPLRLALRVLVDLGKSTGESHIYPKRINNGINELINLLVSLEDEYMQASGDLYEVFSWRNKTRLCIDGNILQFELEKIGRDTTGGSIAADVLTITNYGPFGYQCCRFSQKTEEYLHISKTFLGMGYEVKFVKSWDYANIPEGIYRKQGRFGVQLSILPLLDSSIRWLYEVSDNSGN